MKKNKDISGQKFNRLTAIKFVKRNKRSEQIWLFKCDCGNYTQNIKKRVVSGHTKSCGCLNKEKKSKRLIHYNKHMSIEHRQQAAELGKKSGERIRRTQKEGIKRPDNTSGATGISYDKTLNVWVARLQYRGKSYRERCKTFNQAVKSRKRMEKELGIYTEDGIKAFEE